MKKFALIAVIAIAGISVFADEISDSITANLKTAIKNGKCDDAEKWAKALNEYNASLVASEQVKAAKTANNMLTIYDNLLESVPSIAAGFVKYVKESPWCTNDNEIIVMSHFMKAATTLIERPLTDGDVKSVVDIVVKTEKDEKEALERRVPQRKH